MLQSPEFFSVAILNLIFCIADLVLILTYNKVNKLFALGLYVLGITFYSVFIAFVTKIACGMEFIVAACIPEIFLLGWDYSPKKSFYYIFDIIFILAISYILYIKLRRLPPQQLFLPERRLFLIVNEIFFTCATLGFLLYGCIITDITLRRLEKKRIFVQQQMDYIAKHDPLTGLMNRRRTFQIFLERLNAKLKDNTDFAIAIFDIDNFKKINDTYGHCVGDEVLKTFTKRIWNEYPEPVKISRWGGEEFLIIFPEIDENTIYKLENVRKKVTAKAIICNETEIFVTATFGISSSKKFNTPEQVLNDADKMLYIGKENGKNKIVVSKNF